MLNVCEHGIDLAAEVRPMDRLCAFLATTCLYDALKRDAVAKSNVDEFLFCREAGSSTLLKRLYPLR